MKSLHAVARQRHDLLISTDVPAYPRRYFVFAMFLVSPDRQQGPLDAYPNKGRQMKAMVGSAAADV